MAHWRRAPGPAAGMHAAHGWHKANLQTGSPRSPSAPSGSAPLIRTLPRQNSSVPRKVKQAETCCTAPRRRSAPRSTAAMRAARGLCSHLGAGAGTQQRGILKLMIIM